MSVLAVEVGGTTIRAARFDVATRRLVERVAAPTPNHLAGGGFADVLAAVASLTASLDPAPDVVALAYPGPLDGKGRALATPTVVGGTAQLDLPAECASLWPRARICILNDLSAAGYAYVAAGLRTFAIVTVGSGIGHKVFHDGAPVTGPGGRGGEIGHLRVDHTATAPPCDCGGRGHLGAIASGRGAATLFARRTGRAADGPSLVAAYLADDPDAVTVVHDAAVRLGRALAAIHLDTGVERILLQGGFARGAGERYRAAVIDAARAACWDIGQDWSDIVQFGYPHDDAALLGAALFATGNLA